MRPPRPSDVVVLPFHADDDEDPTIQLSRSHFRPRVRDRAPKDRTSFSSDITRRPHVFAAEISLEIEPDPTFSMRAPPPYKRLPRLPSLDRPQLRVEIEPASSPWVLVLLLGMAALLATSAAILSFNY